MIVVVKDGHRIPLLRYINSKAKAWDRGTVPNYLCSECGAPLYRNPSDIKKNITGRFFCNHECSRAYDVRTRKDGRFARTPNTGKVI